MPGLRHVVTRCKFRGKPCCLDAPMVSFEHRFGFWQRYMSPVAERCCVQQHASSFSKHQEMSWHTVMSTMHMNASCAASSKSDVKCRHQHKLTKAAAGCIDSWTLRWGKDIYVYKYIYIHIYLFFAYEFIMFMHKHFYPWSLARLREREREKYIYMILHPFPSCAPFLFGAFLQFTTVACMHDVWVCGLQTNFKGFAKGAAWMQLTWVCYHLVICYGCAA